MALTIAAYWNSQEIKATLDAVASIMYSGALGAEYGMLLNIMALLGMTAALFAVWVRMRASEAGNHLLAIILIFGALFVPKTSVVIEERAGTVTGGPLTGGQRAARPGRLRRLHLAVRRLDARRLRAGVPARRCASLRAQRHGVRFAPARQRAQHRHQPIRRSSAT